MLDVGIKVDGAVGATGQVDDGDFNAGTQELKNLVTRSGQTLSGANDEQVSEAVAVNAGAASSCVDSGTPNTVVLTPTTGSAGIRIPTTYALYNGWEVFFYIKETNTGNVTVNIGQSAGSPIGAKKLLQLNGDEVPPGSLTSGQGVRARYDPSADSGTGAWVLDMPSMWSSNANGIYTRFSDGTQICTHTITEVASITVAIPPLFQAALAPWVFPAAFSASPSVSFHCNSAGLVLMNGGIISTTTQGQTYTITNLSSAGVTIRSEAIAIGRWF